MLISPTPDYAAVMTRSMVSDGKFQNQQVSYETTLSDMLEMIKAHFTSKREAPMPATELPYRRLSAYELGSESDPVLYRLGHSSVLMRLDGEYLLTDPVFSERASPISFVGPKRFHPVPVTVEELPYIKAVIISHDHYDHLDKATIEALNAKVETFVTPLRVGARLRDWGVAEDKIVELDWWQSTTLGTIKLTATPAQHFSGRGLFDRDQTLWASWVIEAAQAKLFFSGDSGYFDGFKAIGEKFGPFDITMIETGAYNALWSEIHMLPEQSVQAHLDLKGRAMLPIHNATFDLALHDWYEPLERVQQAAEQQQVNLLTPMMGVAVSLQQPVADHAWWRLPDTAPESLVAFE